MHACRSTLEDPTVGWVADQAALQGAVRAVSDFGFELVSVHEVADA